MFLAGAAGKLQAVDFKFDLSEQYTSLLEHLLPYSCFFPTSVVIKVRSSGI